MADPFTISMITMGTGAAMEGMAANQEGKTESALLKYNAAVSRQNAQAAGLAGAEEQAVLRDKMRRDLARNEATVAASGLTMAGSPMEAQLSLISDYAHDIANVGYNAQMESRNQLSQAAAFQMQARAARQAGKLGVAGALVGGVGQMTQLYAMDQMLKKGVGSGKGKGLDGGSASGSK